MVMKRVSRSFLRLTLQLGWSGFLFPQLCAGDLPKKELAPFLEKHCYDCHDDLDEEGGLNLLDLDLDLDEPKNFAMWEKVLHRVTVGEMPPRSQKKLKRPSAEELKSLQNLLHPSLLTADQAHLKKHGRVHTRRLTNEEYRYTLQDLLGTDLALEPLLTPDSEAEGFDNDSEKQQVSLYHLERYLATASAALDEAFTRVLKNEKTFTITCNAKQLTSRSKNKRPAEYRNGKVYCWPTPLAFSNRMNATFVPEDGWYQITLHQVTGVNFGPDQTVWGTLTASTGLSEEPLLLSLGTIEATATPRDLTYTGYIKKDHLLIISPDEAGQRPSRKARAKNGIIIYDGLDLAKDGCSAIVLDGVSMKRVYPHGTKEQVKEKLFGDLPLQVIKENFSGEEAEAKQQLSRLLQRFAQKAFRGPVRAEKLKPYQELALAEFTETQDFARALQKAYTALLCSPYFLTFVEPTSDSGETRGQDFTQPLSHHALANRLSYALWKSFPDAALRQLAQEGRLHDPRVLEQEIDRLLAHPKAARFYNSFTDQWLDLSEIEATQPDEKRFSKYDRVIERSVVEETRHFFRELVQENLSVTYFLKSDFAILTTHLRDYYQLPGTQLKVGGGFQKTPISPESLHSGLLTQASILKVTADGSVTSPVVRGVWVNRRLLGTRIDPAPPNIPAIEPDIRGAVSVREQLVKHKRNATCASCHYKIDPAGFALEGFDPIGLPRSKYGYQKDSVHVDNSGVTPQGKPFKNFREWREIQLQNPQRLAENFTTHFLTYAIGAEPTYSDRAAIKELAARSQLQNYGLKALLKNALTSKTFRTK